MESFDDLVKRQQKEYADLLEYQRGVWAVLRQRHGDDMLPEIAVAFNDQAGKELNQMAHDHNAQRHMNPQYVLIMDGQRQLDIAEQTTRHELEQISVKKEEEQDIFMQMIENQKMLEKRQIQDQEQTM